MNKNGLIDAGTMAAAQASVAPVSKVQVTLKSAKAAAAISALMLALPVAEFFFPQYVPVFAAIKGIASLFGLGA